MKNATAISLTVAAQSDVRTVANRYAAQLQLCCPQSPISYPVARTVHAHMIASGFRPRGHILNRLIDIYCKSSNLIYARHLFDEIPEPDVVARTTLIAAYSSAGNPKLAREIFSGTPLIMRDTVCYNAMITGYSHNNDGHAAIELFGDMRRSDFRPDHFTFTSILGALALIADEEKQCQQMHCAVVKSGTGFVTSVSNALISVHAHMIASGFRPRGHILNRLIDIYCKSSNLIYARHLFDEIPEPDVVARTTLIAAYSSAGNPKLAREIFSGTPLSMRDTVCYNAMITGYSHNNDGHAAIELFGDMRRSEFRPDHFTFTSILGALALIADEEKQCQQMHCAVVKSGTGFVTSVSNALISVYVKCASSPLASMSSLMGAARKLFDDMPERDELTWNAMISGYVRHGYFSEALEMFRKMLLLGIQLDEFTYTSVLSACANAGLFLHGKQVHAYILRNEAKPGRDFSLPVNNALVTLYWKCGKVDEARKIFNKMPERDLISWNVVVSGYVNAGRVDEAKSLFREMPERNLLTWTVMISGLAQNGFGEEALKLFNQMKLEGFEPCDYAFSGAIISCAGLGALEHGRQLHAQLVQFGFESSLSAGNALITMYARCGVVEAADCVFLTMPYVDSVSWNAMIAALGQHGHGAQAIELFEQMLKEGILPDRITFLTVLSACSHAGLVKEGRHYFDSMHGYYGVSPGEDHYARLIDLLCRAGKFVEAKDVIETVPFEPGPPIWEALLAGSRIHGNMDLGIQAAERLFELRPQRDGTYVLLSSMYATVGRWDDVAKVRKLMRDQGVKKEPGCSWIEVESKVHVFLVDDTVHPEVQAVYNYLEQLGLEMRKLGYVADTKFDLHDMEFDRKEYVLSTHSEKLAVGFGLLKLPPGATVRVFKNLRICGDCHNAFKFMSKVVGREIVVRDGKRFHHFRAGKCSCGDYW